ncbi:MULTISPECIES: endonuclease/exonuclease/phosphatase family protein [unclassified Providencia]|uniref:endonuclease/exonuclease/phosphatase family protein n=1 Tax=unclassified Providencia TaxID=2633465 RepID=UPI000E99494A|nr:endonuclease/exonuclease/phosphatase family protein [Providencia sp.]MBP6083444.1 endonuclease/exonuclease/phosphatase family protein [Providencia sp.]HBO24773.1 endonuclease/exonuclease/phosphatase family protein [Providencia sp.]
MAKRTYSVRYIAGQPAERIQPMAVHMLGESLPIGLPLFAAGETLDVVIWNIYKQQRPNWKIVLAELIKDKKLILLQEAQMSPELVSFAAFHKLIADQVPALPFSPHPAGVMTLATAHPIYCCPLREKEPLLRLAKSALITVYPLPNGKQLMVANVHAINFSFGVDVYTRQLNKLGEQIGKHVGPVILAGDFNAWSRQRVNALKRFVRSIGLKEINYNDDQRTKAFGRPLDYLFYRGLQANDSHVLNTDASDHNPIITQFSLLNI